MIKYYMAAAALKMFSINGFSRRMYRRIGNSIGGRKRETQDITDYVSRGDLLVELFRKYDVLQPDKRVLELGTGWMHWFGLYPRLQEELHIDLFDVWDNRQFDAMKSLFTKLQKCWNDDTTIESKARDRLQLLMDAKSFEDLYKSLGMSYTIENNGSLSGYPGGRYDCVYSMHVLEHIPRSGINDAAQHMYRMLVNGGYVVHQIGVDDHLRHYDKAMSPKNYLRYSRKTWSLYFENVVQYHNTLQPSDFTKLFRKAGFDEIESMRETCDIRSLPINADWKMYPDEDLATTILTVVYRKPL